MGAFITDNEMSAILSSYTSIFKFYQAFNLGERTESLPTD